MASQESWAANEVPPVARLVSLGSPLRQGMNRPLEAVLTTEPASASPGSANAIAKFVWLERQGRPEHVLAEWVGALAAKACGLYVSRTYLLHPVSEAHWRVAAETIGWTPIEPYALGVERQAGLVATPGFHALVESACLARLLSFDLLSRVDDRTIGQNPNCAAHRGQLFVFDFGGWGPVLGETERDFDRALSYERMSARCAQHVAVTRLPPAERFEAIFAEVSQALEAFRIDAFASLGCWIDPLHVEYLDLMDRYLAYLATEANRLREQARLVLY